VSRQKEDENYAMFVDGSADVTLSGGIRLIDEKGNIYRDTDLDGIELTARLKSVDNSRWVGKKAYRLTFDVDVTDFVLGEHK